MIEGSNVGEIEYPPRTLPVMLFRITETWFTQLDDVVQGGEVITRTSATREKKRAQFALRTGTINLLMAELAPTWYLEFG
jgi:hypothetical protein